MEADAESAVLLPSSPLTVLSRIVKFCMVFTDGPTVYAIACVFFALLGQLVSPFFFAFHLLDIVHRSETLQAWG